MRPTHRGIAFVAVTLLAVGLLLTVGQPSLGAVAVGLTVLVLAGAVNVLWLVPPTVERTGPASGHVGESRTVKLAFRAPDPYLATVRDRASEGFDAHEATITVGGDPLVYDRTYETRGIHRLGPVEITARDALGLFERRFAVGEERRVSVYPRVRALAGTGVGVPALVEAAGAGADREFDHLREYRSGDSPRDVDWRATAKRDELIVAEYEERGERAVVVAAGGPTERADTLAEAVASVALRLLDGDLAVGLALPDARVAPDDGPGQRERLLEALARTEGGPRPDAEATVEVTVSPGGSVRIDAGSGMVTLDWPPTDGALADLAGGEPA